MTPPPARSRVCAAPPRGVAWAAPALLIALATAAPLAAQDAPPADGPAPVPADNPAAPAPADGPVAPAPADGPPSPAPTDGPAPVPPAAMPDPLAAMLERLGLTYDVQGEGFDAVYLLPFHGDLARAVEPEKDWIVRLYRFGDATAPRLRISATVLDMDREYVFSKPVLARVLQLNHERAGAKFTLDHEFGDLDAVLELRRADVDDDALREGLYAVVRACDLHYAALAALNERWPGVRAEVEDREPYAERRAPTPAATLAAAMVATGLPFEIRGEGEDAVYLVPFERRDAPADAAPPPPGASPASARPRLWTVRVHFANAARRHLRVGGTVLNRPEGYVFHRKVLADALRWNARYAGASLALDPTYGDLDMVRDLEGAHLSPAALRAAIVDVAAAADQAFADLDAADRAFPGRVVSDEAPPAEAPPGDGEQAPPGEADHEAAPGTGEPAARKGPASAPFGRSLPAGRQAAGRREGVEPDVVRRPRRSRPAKPAATGLPC